MYVNGKEQLTGGSPEYDLPAAVTKKTKRRTPEEMHQAWVDSGNQLPDPERVHGKFEVIELYSWQFIKLSQIRGDRNPLIQDLKESIIATGLMNAIDSARVSRELLEEYIAFTNETWGSDARIEDFDAQRQQDGFYYPVIAGHSRHDAIDEAEQEGLQYPIPIQAKVHQVEDVEDFIELQDAENKHSRPKEERSAIAAVEAYNWGVKKGKWSSVDEFVEHYKGRNKITAKGLKEALSYQSLPREIRQFVMTSTIPYLAGVELGKTVKLARDYIAVKCGYEGLSDPRLTDETFEDAKLHQKTLEEFLMKHANIISTKRLNSTASKKYLQGLRGTMGNFLAKERNQDPVEPRMDVLQEVDCYAQLEAERRTIRRDIGQLLGDIKKRPAAEYAMVIQLNQRVIGREKTQEFLSDMERSLIVQLRQIGSIAAREDVELIDEAQEALF